MSEKFWSRGDGAVTHTVPFKNGLYLRYTSEEGVTSALFLSGISTGEKEKSYPQDFQSSFDAAKADAMAADESHPFFYDEDAPEPTEEEYQELAGIPGRRYG